MLPLMKDISSTLAGGFYTTKLNIDPQSNVSTINLIALGNVTVGGVVSANGSITATASKSTGTPDRASKYEDQLTLTS